jgi:hypothetical protein
MQLFAKLSLLPFCAIAAADFFLVQFGQVKAVRTTTNDCHESVTWVATKQQQQFASAELNFSS